MNMFWRATTRFLAPALAMAAIGPAVARAADRLVHPDTTAPAPSVIGSWAGVESQSNPTESYVTSISIYRLTPDAVDGLINYSHGTPQAIGCNETLTLTSVHGADYVFQERKTADSYANCTPTVDTVTLRDPNTLLVNFSGSDSQGAYAGGGALTRQYLPFDVIAPKVTGTTKAGKRLACSTGAWTNSPTSYTYRWDRNDVPLTGATAPAYTVQALDEGSTLTCVVTAHNAAGENSATSNAVTIPVPKIAGCPRASGRMSGTRIGLARLGLTRAQQRKAYTRSTDRGKKYEDFFCLTPIGVRVGYASPLVLKSLRKSRRGSVAGTVIWASTSNPYYSLDGVRPGESITRAAKRLKPEPRFHIGLNDWYIARKAGYTAVLKVRHGIVGEVGITESALTTSRRAQAVLLHSFY